jgi:deaminated glutathione amidase
MKFKVACIQNCATSDVHHDIAVLTRLVSRAAGEEAKLIALPEYCAGLETRNGNMLPFAATEAEHPVIPAMAALARRHHAWLLIGSIGVRAPDGRIYNRSLMISADGLIAARYDKIHLFDVDLGDGEIYRESATIAPGTDAVLSPCLSATVGLSICYDLRFAALYRAYAQAGAELLTIPAAFTRRTGEAHWHVLNRARAIENGAYVISPCQYGTLSGGAQCFGHSLIVDPWGRVLADGGDSEGIIVAEIDLALVADTRARILSLKHDRSFAIAPAAVAAE